MRPRPDPVGPDQRSVWDFPRPAIAERSAAHVRIEHGGQVIADTRASVCTFETSHPPSYYILPDDIAPGVLRISGGGLLLRVEGLCTLLGRGDRQHRPAARWLELSRSDTCLRHAAGPCRLLRHAVRPLLGQWRNGRPTAGLVLRWLDHQRPRRSFQGRPREHGLVSEDPFDRL